MGLKANFRKFFVMALSGILAATLYSIGQYIITGQTDIVHTLKFTITFIVAGFFGFWIAIKMMHY